MIPTYYNRILYSKLWWHLCSVEEGDENEDEEVQVAKYRRLMQELNKGGQGSKSDDEEQGDMEVTWEPGG
jgi:hypothetical protein